MNTGLQRYRYSSISVNFTGCHGFGFNGKEKVNEQYGEGNAYDFGARIYDPRIGRWLSRDPQASKYSHLSPYNFVDNSPLRYIDPNGEEILPVGNVAAVNTALQTHWGNLFGANSQTTQALLNTFNAGSGTYSGDNNKDTRKAFRQAMNSDNLTPQQKVLARGYFRLITSDSKAYVSDFAMPPNSSTILPVGAPGLGGEDYRFPAISYQQLLNQGGLTVINEGQKGEQTDDFGEPFIKSTYSLINTTMTNGSLTPGADASIADQLLGVSFPVLELKKPFYDTETPKQSTAGPQIARYKAQIQAEYNSVRNNGTAPAADPEGLGEKDFK